MALIYRQIQRPTKSYANSPRPGNSNLVLIRGLRAKRCDDDQYAPRWSVQERRLAEATRKRMEDDLARSIARTINPDKPGYLLRASWRAVEIFFQAHQGGNAQASCQISASRKSSRFSRVPPRSR